VEAKSQEFLDLITAINKDLTIYVIEPTTLAIGEEGKYVDGKGSTVGYAVVNTITGVIEHTSVILPGVIYQAQHFDNMLRSMLSKGKEPTTLEEAPVDDVVFN
jgi:hypothetical protein